MIKLTFRSRTLPEQFHSARIAINNTMEDEEVQAALAEFGFDAPTMTEGKNLLSAALSRVNKARGATGAAQLSTQFAKESFTALKGAYQDFAKVARAAFLRDRPALALLGLNRKMPDSAAAVLSAAETLFNTGEYTPAIRAKLAKRGYTDAKLSQERSKISEYAFAKDHQAEMRGAAQQAKDKERTARKELVDWVAEFSKVARVALKKQPQMLEKIGLLARNGKTKAQRQAPLKAAATRKAKQSKAA